MRLAAVITLVVTTALSLTSAQMMSLDYLWNKTEAFKVMDSCLQKDMTKVILKLVEKSFNGCYNASSFDNFTMNVDSLEPLHWEKLFNDFAANSTKIRANGTSTNTNNDGSRTSGTRNNTNGIRGNTDGTRSNTGGTERNSNSTHLFAPLVDTLRCAYRRIGVSDENNSINVKKIIEGYKSMNLSPTLEENILTAVNQCHELAQCLPLDKSGDTRIPEDLLRLKTYVNCELYLRNWACLKNDLKNTAPSCEMNLSGADGILGSRPNDGSTTSITTTARTTTSTTDTRRTTTPTTTNTRTTAFTTSTPPFATRTITPSSRFNRN